MTVLLKFQEEVILDGEYIILKPDVTEEEFWKISSEDSNYELIDGVLVIHSPASEEHGDILLYISTILRFYLEEMKLGRIYGSRFVMRLSKKWTPEPDLMIITPKNYDNIQENRYDGPADIVIEIQSKSTREIDFTKKLPKYLETGVLEVWMIDPQEKYIAVYTKTSKKEWKDVTSTEKIQSTVLPNVPLQINWIWNRNKHPTNEIIRNLIKDR